MAWEASRWVAEMVRAKTGWVTGRQSRADGTGAAWGGHQSAAGINVVRYADRGCALKQLVVKQRIVIHQQLASVGGGEPKLQAERTALL